MWLVNAWPARIVFQKMSQQARGLVFGIVDLHRGGFAFAGLAVTPAKQLHSAVQIDTVIVDDHARHVAGGVGGFLQGRIHLAACPALGRRQFDQLHVLVPQALPTRRQIGQTDAQDHQALFLSNLHRMIDQPRPVIGRRLVGREHRVAQPHQPKPPTGPVRHVQPQAQRLADRFNHPRRPTQGNPRPPATSTNCTNRHTVSAP